MPTIERFIEDINTTNNRPIVQAVIKQMCEAIGINPKINIFYPDGKPVVNQPGGAITDTDNTARFSTTEHLLVTVKEGPGFGGLYYDVRHRAENKPIFADPKLGFFIGPIITNREFEITVKYVAPDRVSGDAWLEYIRSRILNTTTRLLHRARGSFLLPKDASDIIEHIYELRENVAPHGQSLGDYFWEHADKKFTIMTDQNGENKAVAYAMNYAEFYGCFELNEEPEKQKEDEKNETVTVEFTYKFQIDVPTSILIKYPIIVHNQYIDPKYIFEIPVTPYDELEKAGTAGVIVGDYFSRKGPQLPQKFRYGIVIPKHDTWDMPSECIPKHTLTMFRALATIDTKYPKDLLKITDVTELELPDAVVKFMASESRHMLVDSDCLFQLNAFEQDDPLMDDEIIIGDDLSIGLSFKAHLRHYYHVRLGVYLDLKWLTDRSLEALQENPEVVDWWIKTYHPDWTTGNADWPPGWKWDDDKIKDIEDGKKYIPDDVMNILADRSPNTIYTVETFNRYLL